MAEIISPHAQLAHALVTARDEAGFQTQVELAARLGVKQQSVSRWEAGTHRPRPAQLAALATLLGLKVGDLLVLAGYEQPTTQSLAAPLPVDRLDPTSFEQFVAAVAHCLHPNAEVRRAGGQGHAQGGTDVIINLPDGRCLDLQCKRMARFGPVEVAKAVRAYSRSADQKIIVLSRVASPQADEAIRRHAGWSLWDKDRLTRIFRQDIAPVDQDALVDIYFPGQRRLLLGRDEPGAWLNADRFFRPFSSPQKLISHEWHLVGRERELAELLSAISGDGLPVAILVGAGGIGKSRLLREIASSLEQVEPATTLRFLDPDKEVTQADLEALGPGPKLIIVDDAHDRDRLGLLFAFAADPSRQARVLVSTRPYALARIRQEAATYSVTDIPTVMIDAIGRTSRIALAKEVLAENGGDLSWAETVANESDSPLATTLFARVAGRTGVPPELARGTADVRDLTSGKFTKILLGEVGRGSDARVNRDVLEILALVQPFHPEDPGLLDLLNSIKQVPRDRASRALRRLMEGGITFRRGGRYRLMPDLLGDCLIEDSCMSSVGALAPFATEALRVMPPALLSNALVNLGRLDWRLAGGDPTNSRLLDDVWRGFSSIKEDGDLRLEAVKAVAAFQPRQALDLAASLIRGGRRLSCLADVLRGVAYHSKHLREACDLLWRLGRDDRRELHTHPSHPLRILIEAGGYGPDRSRQHSEQVLTFALGLMDDLVNWKGAHTPLTLLEPLMRLEGETTRSTNRGIAFSPFYVHYEAVAPIRKAVINRILALLEHDDVAIACHAAEFVAKLLYEPIGIFNTRPPATLVKAVRLEACRTLRRIAGLVPGNLAPPVLLALARVAAFQKHHRIGLAAKLGASICRQMPDDLGFRLLAALGNGSTIYMPDATAAHWHEDEQAWLTSLVAGIRMANAGADCRRAFLECGIRTLSDAGQAVSSHHFAGLLLHGDRELQRVIVEDALAHPDGLTVVHAGTAMMMLMAEAPLEARPLAHRLVESGKDDLVRAIAIAYHGLQEAPSVEDISILRGLLGATPDVVREAARAVALLYEASPVEKVELLVHARVDGDPGVADELARVLCGLNRSLLDHLRTSDALQLLGSLEPIPQLDGHWVDELVAELSRRFPIETADFLMRRVERASATKSYGFRAANHSPYGHRKLGFLTTGSGQAILSRTWVWLLKHWRRDHVFRYAATGMFEAMFLHDVDRVVGMFSQRLAVAGGEEIDVMAAVLRKANPDFVFAQASFVERLLERRAELNIEAVDKAVCDLFASAISGVHSGMRGEPMLRDILLRDRAEVIIRSLSRASAAFPLYESLRVMAVGNVERARAEADGSDAE